MSLCRLSITSRSTPPNANSANCVADTSLASPGITTHWNVSEYWLNGDGHWDCWPIHMGGHFPALYVVNKAQQILAAAEA